MYAINMKIPKELAEKLKLVAENNSISFSAQIRLILLDYVRKNNI